MRVLSIGEQAYQTSKKTLTSYRVGEIGSLWGAAGLGESAKDEIIVGENDLNDYVGQPPFTSDRIYEITPPGVVMGLAWSSQGGNALYVEAASIEKRENRGSLKTTTGESIQQTALPLKHPNNLFLNC